MSYPGYEYPTDDQLKELKEWEVKTLSPQEKKAWLDRAVELWWMPDWGVTWTRYRLYISTGGWSGNESIIGAMMGNWILWGQTWHSSRRGGHFIFQFRDREDDGNENNAKAGAGSGKRRTVKGAGTKV